MLLKLEILPELLLPELFASDVSALLLMLMVPELLPDGVVLDCVGTIPPVPSTVEDVVTLAICPESCPSIGSRCCTVVNERDNEDMDDPGLCAELGGTT